MSGLGPGSMVAAPPDPPRQATGPGAPPHPPSRGSPAPAQRHSHLAFAAGVFVLCLFALLATDGDYGITSDVGNYFESSRLQRVWAGEVLRALVSLDFSAALDTENLLEHWRWRSYRIPHPPLSRELHGLTGALTGAFLGQLTGYRLATLLAFSVLAVGVGWLLLRADRTMLAAVSASLGLVSIPAVFAHAHFAAADMLLTAFWFGAVVFLEVYRREPRRRWLLLTGVSVGAAVATKFTGLLLGPVLLVWMLLHRRVFSLRAVASIGALAMLVFVAVNPVMWVDPLLGISDYLRAGFARADRTTLTTYYFGAIYAHRPPWHYPFIWTLIVVPIPILVAVIAGIVGSQRSGLARLCLLNLAVLYGALLLPSAPLHDGVRLFLPAFPFLAVLVGLGAEAMRGFLWSRWPGQARPSRDFVATIVCASIFIVPIFRTAQYHPYQLSYFNGLIGGVRGAATAGLEISNMKEALSPSVLDELARVLPPDAVVDPGFFLEEFCFYRSVGWLPDGWVLETAPRGSAGSVRTLTCAVGRPMMIGLARPPAPPQFVFVLNRRGQQTAAERALIRFGGDPFFQVALQGVPLLRVYRIDE